MRRRLIRWVLPLALVLAVAPGAALGLGMALHVSATVKLATTGKYGKVLVSGNGLSLYRYTPDPLGRSVCSGACLKLWPPLLVTGAAKPTVGPGLKASLVAVVKRANGSRQVSYAGHPLYLYRGDHKPGDLKGEGSAGIWFLVNASGALLKHSLSMVPPPTTTSGGSSSWG